MIVNEFGEISLDHELVERADEMVVETTSGCLCCTVQGDVRRTVLSLIYRARDGEIPPFSRIIIETTGLADPAPVLQTFMADRALTYHVVLNGVITLVDAVNGPSTLERFEEARRQVSCADIVLITKTDLIPPDEIAAKKTSLLEQIAGLNRVAKKVDLATEDFAPDALLALAAYDPDGKAPDVLEWLTFEGTDAPADHGHVKHDHHHDHEHDPNRHGDDVNAYCLAFDAPLNAKGFWFALEMLQAFKGEQLLRFKGLVALDDAPDRPVVVHGVQHVTSPPVRLDCWPSSDHRTRLVLIAKDIAESEIRDTFAMFEPPARPKRRGLI